MNDMDDIYNISKMCLESVKEVMPVAIEKFYIEKYLPENVRLEVKDMLENVLNSMLNRIQNLEWLDDSTREYAIEKVMKLKYIIGYKPYIDEKSFVELYDPIPLNSSFLSIKRNLKYYYKKDTFEYFIFDSYKDKLEKRLIQENTLENQNLKKKDKESYVSINYE